MSPNNNLNKILIIDFGSQFTQLIARRIRELGVFSEIINHKKTNSLNIFKNVKGIILSGGPLSVYQNNKVKFNKKIIELGIPILGICYGMQLITQHFGGEVVAADHHEYGKAKLKIKNDSSIFKGIEDNSIVR